MLPHAAVRALARSASLVVAAWAAASCADRDPASAVAGPDPARAVRRAAVAPAPAATTPVTVQVPASMRSAPFDVTRTLTVPSGFGVSVYARVPGARFMAVAPNGDLLVSRPGAGRVVRVRPGAGGADPTVADWVTGLRNPHDVVFATLGGVTYVYVAESHQINRYVYNAADGSAGARAVVVGGLPDASSPELGGAHGHQLKNIALANGKLYVSSASASNASPSDVTSSPKRAAVYEYNADGSGGRLFAEGLRNAEGLAFVPGTSALWVTVNHRDNIAYPHHRDFDGDGRDDYGRVMQAYVDNHPPEQFTRVRDGANYGWPYCNPDPDGPGGLDDMPYLRDVQNNADGSRLDCAALDRTSKGIQAHSAPLGLTFLQGTNAPAAYREGAMIALHGSWNRATKTGYKVVHFAWDAAAGGGGLPGTQTDFVTGWATANSQWGRPVDVAVAPDGGLYVSDDYSGTIYRVAPAAAEETGRFESPLVGAASGRCLADPASSTTPGTQLIIWQCNGYADQRWSLPAVGTAGAVRVLGSLCVGTAGTDGAPVTIQNCSGGAEQRWTLTSTGALRHEASGRCTAVAGGATANGANVELRACTGDGAQRWTPSAGNGRRDVTLVGAASGRCLADPASSTTPGTQMIVWQCNGYADQRWSVPAVGAAGEMRVLGLCVAPAQAGAGAGVVLQACNGSAAQQWTPTAAGELRSSAGLCADVSGGRTDDGAPVIVWTCHGAANQRWDARP